LIDLIKYQNSHPAVFYEPSPPLPRTLTFTNEYFGGVERVLVEDVVGGLAVETLTSGRGQLVPAEHKGNETA